MVIDYYCLMIAVSPARANDRFPEHKGWLSRHTGEIVYLIQNDHDAEHWFGKDVAVDMVFNRAEIDANKGEWIEIPKYEGFHEDTSERASAREHFAIRFLANCNLGKYAVTVISTNRAIAEARRSILPEVNSNASPAMNPMATMQIAAQQLHHYQHPSANT